jgi:hypothetical protein
MTNADRPDGMTSTRNAELVIGFPVHLAMRLT